MDESFWIAISFLIFLYFIYKPARNAILNTLDKKIDAIKKHLEESEQIKRDANRIFDDVVKNMQNFEEYKKQILQSAENSTAKLIETRTKEMDLMLVRKRDLAIKSIENEKEKAADKLRDEFTDKVIVLVRDYLTKTKNNNVSDKEIIDSFTKIK
jgi:F-type H+-transporting ATPase subunit b